MFCTKLDWTKYEVELKCRFQERISKNARQCLLQKRVTLIRIITKSQYDAHTSPICYNFKLVNLINTPNSKKVFFWIVALCIAHCCIPRPQSTMDVTNLCIVACQDRKAFCSTLLPWLIHKCRCLMHSRYLQCYLKIRYIHGALQSWYVTIRNARCNNSEDNLFWIRCIHNLQGGLFMFSIHNKLLSEKFSILFQKKKS